MKGLWNFSNAVFHARTAKGLTQEQTAEALGISVRWYQCIKKGVGRPGFDLLLRIMILLELDARDCVDDNVAMQLLHS